MLKAFEARINWAISWGMRKICHLAFREEWKLLESKVSDLRGARVAGDLRSELNVLRVALVLAEDRRFFEHAGVDVRAMLRAVVVYFVRGSIQGGSTISQQLVRNLTSNYARTLRRKWKELLLASMLDVGMPKEEILDIYLSVAYFGWRMNGLRQALKRMSFQLPITEGDAAQIVARLKYPEPQVASEAYRLKVERRASFILQLLAERRGRE